MNMFSPARNEPTRPLKVVVVDDSVTSRALITNELRADNRLNVIGSAHTALMAKDMIIQLQPDLITLDLEMPGMNGLEFLSKVMRLRPMPVVIVSSLTSSNGRLLQMIQSIGAASSYTKRPKSESRSAFEGLPDLVVESYRAFHSSHALKPRQSDRQPDRQPDQKIVAIGSSTGGISALMRIISSLPGDFPPVVVVQHLPPSFGDGLARSLGQDTKMTVKVAEDGSPLIRGQVLICPGADRHLEIVRSGSSFICRLTDSPPVSGHRPSANVLFSSVAKAAGSNAVGVILSGIGDDGASGLLAMRNAGAVTIAQDEQSSVVYGMPRQAVDLGAVTHHLPIADIAPLLLSLTQHRVSGDKT